MLLQVNIGVKSVHFELHYSFMGVGAVETLSTCLPNWFVQFTSFAGNLVFGDVPFTVLNHHLPVGIDPCLFVWDLLITVLFDHTQTRY